MSDSQNEECLRSPLKPKFLGCSPQEWTVFDVIDWIKAENVFSAEFEALVYEEKIDGKALLELTEADLRDVRYKSGYKIKLGERKKILIYASDLKMKNGATLNIDNHESISSEKKIPCNNHSHHSNGSLETEAIPSNQEIDLEKLVFEDDNSEKSTPKAASLGSKCIPPDVFKTALSLAYSFLVTWITSFVMVIVHERVPDMKRYPPLPDIFLDNVPHIPWAFHMCEITGTLLFLIWSSVCIFHKHRLVLLRRFFALAGTVFLLRCVTMLITSLSVPGTHLQCNQKDYAVDDTSMSFIDSLEVRVSRAYSIWSGLGMSIQGVRTCGDYMFSGHTVALTLLNFFITEYTPRNLYFLHTLTWLLNMFGIFFILAAHEHYSIDVFVAFYITSRLFLYYHTLANNQALMSRDSNRTRIWFPMFSYFESSVEGIIPNEYDSLSSLFEIFVRCFVYIKDSIVIFVQRIWIESHKMTAPNQKNTAAYTKTYPKFIENYQFKQDTSLLNNDDITKRRPLQTKETSSEHKSKELHESIECKKSQ